MEKLLQQILEGQNRLLEAQQETNQRLENIEGRIDNLEGQVKENNDFIQALIHRTDELEAKFDGLLHTTATKDSIITLNSKFDVLNDRLFQQETELRTLKMAK